MPYIKQNRRYTTDALKAGELNYQITRLLNKYRADHGNNYRIYNDILGALEGAKLEFYRRVVMTYEDKKMEENGDVYQ